MKALVAVQRKLLELMCILFKNKSLYDHSFEQNKAKNKKFFTLSELIHNQL